MPFVLWVRRALLAAVCLVLTAACLPGERTSSAAPVPTPRQTGPTTIAVTTTSAPPTAAPATAARPAPTPTTPAVDRGQVLSKQLKGSASIAQIDEMENTFLIVDHDIPSHYAVDWYRIEFTGADLNGKPLKLVGQIFIPKSDAAATFPIYVFGPGTTGLVDECAPSLEEPTERSWGDFQSHLLTYGTQGYVAIMPDFEGFNDGPPIHHYYVGELQAHVLLDAARAALRFFDQAGQPPAKKDNPVFFAGYSHGGYVALAARDFAHQYAPELNVKGAIGYGPRSDPTTLFRDMPSLGPLLLYSYADYYGRDKIPVERILLPRWQRTWEHDALSMCIDEIPTYYGDYPPDVYTAEFLAAIDNHTVGEKFPALGELLHRNVAGLGGKDIPLIVLQGTEDTVVYPATLKAYMKEVCATGARAAYLSYPGQPHFTIRQIGYEDTLIWMSAVLKGQTAWSTCG